MHVCLHVARMYACMHISMYIFKNKKGCTESSQPNESPHRKHPCRAVVQQPIFALERTHTRGQEDGWCVCDGRVRVWSSYVPSSPQRSADLNAVLPSPLHLEERHLSAPYASIVCVYVRVRVRTCTCVWGGAQVRREMTPPRACESCFSLSPASL